MLLKRSDFIRLSSMFLRDKERVLESLLALRENICSYTPGSRCDCKYGYGDPELKHYGEVCGCPEVSCALYILARMTDEEYEEIANRKLPSTFDVSPRFTS